MIYNSGGIMSEVEKKAKEYEEKIKIYENLNIKPLDLSKYHAISEQEFDKDMSKLEEALQEDIKKIPDVLVAYDKLLSPLKKIK